MTEKGLQEAEKDKVIQAKQLFSEMGRLGDKKVRFCFYGTFGACAYDGKCVHETI